MSAAKLIQLEDGLQIFAASNIEVRFLHEEIFLAGCYDGISLPDHAFVIDAGANIGMFALFLKRRYPDAKILAFEPAPQSVAILRQNIGLHALTDIEVREIALGATAEPQAPFTYYPAIPGSSTRYPGQIGPAKTALGKIFTERVADRFYRGREIVVPVERLSASLGQGREVDLLKVDVEGAELDVLLGIDAGHWPLIRQAILEVQEHGDRLETICALLASHGLEPTVGRGPQSETDVPAHIVHAVRKP